MAVLLACNEFPQTNQKLPFWREVRHFEQTSRPPSEAWNQRQPNVGVVKCTQMESGTNGFKL